MSAVHVSMEGRVTMTSDATPAPASRAMRVGKTGKEGGWNEHIGAETKWPTFRQ